MADLERARALYNATKHLRLADITPIDFKDRLSLLTVAAGLRPVGVLECTGLETVRVRDAVVNCGLHTLVSGRVWSIAGKPNTDNPHRRALQMMEDFSSAAKPGSVLWFCASRQQRNEIKKRPSSEVEGGILLGYSECCVRFEFRERFLTAVPETDARYPFVLHVACDACLTTADSPSAKLNEEFERLALNIDAKLHSAVRRVGQLSAELKSADRSRVGQIRREMDLLRKSLFAVR